MEINHDLHFAEFTSDVTMGRFKSEYVDEYVVETYWKFCVCTSLMQIPFRR